MFSFPCPWGWETLLLHLGEHTEEKRRTSSPRTTYIGVEKEGGERKKGNPI